MTIRKPAQRPCQSCPYRRDVSSGIWAAEEYAKLRAYDRETAAQPVGLFQCHQADAASPGRRICAGWAGCHGYELLALRLAVVDGRIDAETFQAAANYRSPVPLFHSGADAADHGQAGIDNPSPSAQVAIEKITRRRRDLRLP